LSRHVVLRNNATQVVVESGSAVETAVGSGEWIYTTQNDAGMVPDVVCEVVVTDRPGGIAVKQTIINLPY